MDIKNAYALFSLVLTIVSIIIILPAVPRQIKQVRRPRDELTELRWYLLWLLILYILCVFPRVLMLFQILDEPATSVVSNVVDVTNGIGLFCFSLFMDLVFSYREKK